MRPQRCHFTLHKIVNPFPFARLGAEYLPRSMSLGIFSEDEGQAYIAYKQNMGKLADFVPDHEILKLTGHVMHSLAFF